MLDENIKNNDELYVVDFNTCTAMKLSDVPEITEHMIVGTEDTIIEASKLISSLQSTSVEIEFDEDNEPSSSTKPNPIYIPKHIAKRRKW